MNILHFETSTLIAKVVEQIVMSTGLMYFNAGNLDEGMNILKGNDIDLVITATEFAEYEGESIIQVLKHNSYGHIPILVVSATENIKTRMKYYDEGVVDYIVKDQMALYRLKSYLKSFHSNKNCMKMLESQRIAVIDQTGVSFKLINNIFTMHSMSNVHHYSNSKNITEEHLSYDIYIIDLKFEGISGDILIAQLKAINPNSIIILIAGNDNYKSVTNLLMSGASECIIKPFDSSILMTRIKNQLKIRKTIRELESQNDKLDYLSRIDALTGISNRFHLMERFDELAEKVTQNISDFSIIIFDVDDFKQVNDHYGHSVGDDVLKEVAKIMKENLRKKDFIGRYGGEEFMLLLPETSLAEAKVIGERIRVSIQDACFSLENLKVTISGGVSGTCKRAIKDIINHADSNLYKAKQMNKNRIVC